MLSTERNGTERTRSYMERKFFRALKVNLKIRKHAWIYWKINACLIILNGNHKKSEFLVKKHNLRDKNKGILSENKLILPKFGSISRFRSKIRAKCWARNGTARNGSVRTEGTKARLPTLWSMLLIRPIFEVCHFLKI